MPNAQQGFNISDSAQINPGVVTGSDIADDAIDSQHYAADSIDNEHYAPGSITNTEIDANAAIADTKLGTISTAGKVSGAALTSLASTPAGAGVIPSANLPSFSETKRFLAPGAMGFSASCALGEHTAQGGFILNSPNNADNRFGGFVTVPEGKTSISSVKLLCSKDGAGSENAMLRFMFSKSPIAANAVPTTDVTDSLTAYAIAGSDSFTAVSVPSSAWNGLGSLASGDVIGILVYHTSSDASDTLDEALHVSGIEFTFA